MCRLKISTLALSALALSITPAWAQVGTTVVITPPSPPQSLSVDNQIYEGSLEGMREYFETFKNNEVANFAQLDPGLSQLEKREHTANWILWPSMTVGLGLVLAPAFYQPSDPADNTPVKLAYVGLGIFAAGYIGWAIVKPSRKEMLNLLNEHNRTRPEHPIRLQLGLLPLDGGFGVASALSF